jgi:hypothetical protein
MKRAQAIIVLLLLLFAGQVFAAENPPANMIDFWGAITNLSMKDFNSAADRTARSYSNNYPDSTAGRLNLGYVIGAGLNFYCFGGSNLSAGPRIELIDAFQASASFTGSALDPDISIQTDAYFVPFMAGAAYKFTVPRSQWCLTADIYLGYGPVKLNEINDSKGVSTAFSYTGGALAADLDISANYSVTDDFTFGFRLGYRGASAAEVFLDSGSGSVLRSTPYKDAAGSITPLDFSGFELGLVSEMEF